MRSDEAGFEALGVGEAGGSDGQSGSLGEAAGRVEW